MTGFFLAKNLTFRTYPFFLSDGILPTFFILAKCRKVTFQFYHNLTGSPCPVLLANCPGRSGSLRYSSLRSGALPWRPGASVASRDDIGAPGCFWSSSQASLPGRSPTCKSRLFCCLRSTNHLAAATSEYNLPRPARHEKRTHFFTSNLHVLGSSERKNFT